MLPAGIVKRIGCASPAVGVPSIVKPTLIPKPARVEAAGNKPKLIDEYIGRVNSATSEVSIAHMRSPGGWVEPGQTPDFEEYTMVLKGVLRVEFARRRNRRFGGAGGHRPSRRMGPLQHAGPGRRRIYRRVPPRLFPGRGAPRSRLNPEFPYFVKT